MMVKLEFIEVLKIPLRGKDTLLYMICGRV